MSNEQVIIRQSKKIQFVLVLFTGMAILWYFIGPYEKNRIIYTESPKFTVLLGIIVFGMFFYFLNELIKRKAEITLTKEGIELRDKGFFDWNMIESFSTLDCPSCDSYNLELIIHFKEFADLKFSISYLEKDKNELVNLILTFKGTESVHFVGHLSK